MFVSVRNKLYKIILMAILGIAITFTLSCTSEESNNNYNNCPSSGFGGDRGNDIANYETKQIGTQVWMAENLNYAVEGSECYGQCGVSWDDNDDKLYKALSNAEIQASCDKYGRIYDWATAMALPDSCNSKSCSDQIQPKHRGICHIGWHIPSKEDWGELLRYVDDSTGTSNPYSSLTAGRYLKATSGWNNYNGNSGNGLDTYGFSALPGGYGYSSSNFYNIGSYGYWWSANENDNRNASSRIMGHSDDEVDYFTSLKSRMYSVRCVRD